MTSLESAIRIAIEPIISEGNLFLEELQLSIAGKHRIIRILVDGEKTLSLEEVTSITKPISERLDHVVELGERAFTLEVSSPGVDFPLTLPRHWRKNLGRLVTFTRQNGEKVNGRIKEATNSLVMIEMKDGTVKEILLEEIPRAAIEIEFK